jgi:ATP-dependent RNA helicase DHX57
VLQPGGTPLRDLATVPDGATVEFTAVAPPEAAAAPAAEDSAPPDADDADEAGLAAALAARRSAASALCATRLSPADAAAESQRLRAAARPSPMAAQRAALPCAPLKQQILDALAGQDVLLLAGETGSGKSTQVPQYVLEDAIERGVGAETYVIVAQPRRVAATSLARRVAAERGERPGELVGFAVRGASQTSRRTRVLYCTTGILLRRLTDDPSLPGVSHVFIDEVHERSLDVDMCLLLLRRSLAAAAADAAAPRPPRVCLMSATADAAPLAAYFGPRAGVLRVPGRVHPVQTLFLEDILAANPDFRFAPRPPPSPHDAARRAADGPPPQMRLLEVPGDRPSTRDSPLPQRGYNDATLAIMRGWDSERVDYPLLALAVTHAVTRCCGGSPGGSVLVFLPGAPEITRAASMLEAHAPLRAARICCVPLHGSLPPSEQQLAFEPAAQGRIKVVLATNVAETALTIPDVTCVVDTARVKEMSFDAARGVGRLKEGLACRAALAQRAGRAGRLRPGVHSMRCRMPSRRRFSARRLRIRCWPHRHCWAAPPLPPRPWRCCAPRQRRRCPPQLPQLPRRCALWAPSQTTPHLSG